MLNLIHQLKCRQSWRQQVDLDHRKSFVFVGFSVKEIQKKVPAGMAASDAEVFIEPNVSLALNW